MVLAIMKKYGATREKIREGLSEISYDGVIGTYKADEEGNLWRNAMVIEFLPDGKAKPVHRYQQLN
jgi:branched-chain amino acid transport system substrate-binding protein